MRKFKVWSDRNIRAMGRDVVFTLEEDGNRLVSVPLVFKPHMLGTVTDPVVPTGDGDDFLQTVLDHAWDIGMRPTGFGDTTREVSALRAHLEDMRHLAFKRNPFDY
jgi:hypothetical protein